MQENQHNTIAACARFEDELPAYLEGEARPYVAAHSQDCPSCEALLADVQSVQRAARELPQETPSPMVWAKVRARLEEEGALAAASCVQFEDELQARLEGEARPFVAAHSQDCPSCGALLADLQSLRNAARELPQETPSPMVWAKVRARLEEEGALVAAACLQFDDELEGYLEGEARPFVAAHAAACNSCRTLLADVESIHRAARDLPLEEPSRAIWANVRARLEAEDAFGTPVSDWRQILAWRFLPHAVPLGVLAGFIFLGSVLTLPSGSVQPWASADVTATSSALPQMASLTSGEASTLAHVVSDLENDFRANEASMAPDLKATYDKSLVALDGSIHECLDSLHQEPGNALAREYLLTAYTRKAEVLSSALEFEGR